MPRTWQDIADEIGNKKAKLAELVGELSTVNDLREKHPTNRDGYEERGRRITSGITNLEAEISDLEGEYRDALKAEITSGGLALEGGDGSNPAAAPPRSTSTDPTVVTADTVALTPQQTMAAWAAAHRVQDAPDVTLKGIVRGLTFGTWGEAEARAITNQASTVGSDGGFLVPSTLSTSVLDQARNQARVVQAGAVTVPMPTAEFSIARVAGDPSASWRKERQAIAETGATFERMKLVAKTLAALVKIPLELIEDSGTNVESLISQILAEVVALELDRVALFGDGDQGEPVGLLNTPGVAMTSLGASPANWDFVINRAGVVEDRNYQPTAAITSPRVGRQMALLKDTTNQPLRRPERISYPILETNQVPTDQGSGSDESLLAVGDWRQLVLGLRTNLQLIPLRERFADTGEVGLIVWTRGDVGLARTNAFAVQTGIEA